MPRNLPVYLALLMAGVLSSCASQDIPRGVPGDEVTGKAEEIYVFRTIRTRHERESVVGGFTACLGRLAVGQSVSMYATGTVAHIPWTGIGVCAPLKWQPPVRTAIAFTCRLDLAGLPAGYLGGFLVSSTLAPLLGTNQPANAHVRGYLSTSVVAVRLWSKADADQPR